MILDNNVRCAINCDLTLAIFSDIVNISRFIKGLFIDGIMRQTTLHSNILAVISTLLLKHSHYIAI